METLRLISWCLIFFISGTEGGRSNSCKHFESYFAIDISNDCYYNPDVFSSVPDILKEHMGTFEKHSVTTEDGYILTIFRIPKKKPKGVVILQHPVSADSSIYVIQDKDSLAFLLSREGYDVWLPNHRGTSYSNQHVNLSFSDFSYWDFGFHEIGVYDYSSIIRYIKENTGRSDIIFIGHSMSTTSSLVYASLKPDEAKESIKVLIQMSPTAVLQHVRSPAVFLAPLEPFIRELFGILKIGPAFKTDSLEYHLKNLFIYLPFKRLVVLFLMVSCGWTPGQFEPDLSNALLAHSPASYSPKIYFHYAQIVNAGGIFQFFNYGKRLNMKLYGKESPPEYPLKNITVPVYLITSRSDSLATTKDSRVLYDKLSEEAKIYGKVDISKLNHIEFHVGKNRIEDAYSHIFKLLQKIS